MNAVFEAIVWWEANYGLSFGYPLPRSAIMHEKGLNIYQYRKQIKELKENGLIAYTRYIEYDFCEGYLQDSYLVQGWMLTGKGRRTEEFQKASLEAKEIDFTKFGREFRNCVGSYARDVIRKDCLIVIARDVKTKDLKLCIEITGENSAYTKDKIRYSFQYKSFFNKRPKEEDLPSLIEWYKTLNIDNSRCYDVYWEEKVDGEVARVVNRGPMVIDDDIDLPF